MRRGFSLIFPALILGGIFCCLNFCLAAQIAINEIAAYESSGDEWLEIYNYGEVPVDLTGWKFWENNTNHGLSLFQGEDLIINVSEYAIIADNAVNFKAKYPEFIGTIIDSAFSLSESGEEIGLKNSSGDLVESFTYLSAPNFSLERIDATIADYTAANWREHASGNTVGAINSVSGSVSTTTATTTDIIIEETTTTPEIISTTVSFGEVAINEFLSAPIDSDKEWVEIFNNTTDSVDLTGWTLHDNSSTSTLDGIIGSLGFYVVEFSSAKLNNAGDIITLKDATGKIIDQIIYGDWDSDILATHAPAPGKGYAAARTPEGRGGFSETISPTRGAANVIIPREIIFEENTSSDSTGNTTNSTTVSVRTISESERVAIVINEILPKPEVADNEFIELKNISQMSVDLSGWRLVDRAGSKYIFSSSTVIKAGEFLVVGREESGISLNNTGGEDVSLLAPDKAVVFKVSYDSKVETNQSWVCDENNIWQWTDELTPGAANIIILKDFSPQAVINFFAEEFVVGEAISFDASESLDPRGLSLKYRWEFGDGSTSNRSLINHRFTTPGEFLVTLKVINSKEASSTATTAVIINEKIAAQKNDKNDKGGEKFFTFADLDQAESGDQASVRGVVLVAPGVFGSQYFYIQDSSQGTAGGIQIYSAKKLFPDLKIGDEVEVNGVVSQSNGEKRIKISALEDIVIIGQTNVEPGTTTISELNEGLAGSLITISGEILERQSSKIYLDDETGEIEVYLKRGAGITGLKVAEGQKLTATGVLIFNNSGYQLLPRQAEDLVLGEVKGESETVEEIVEEVGWTKKEKYFLVMIIFLGGVVVRLGWRKKLGVGNK